MNFEGNTLLIVVGALVALLILFALLKGRKSSTDGGAPAGEEGRTITDEGAAAARDVAGEILGVDCKLDIPAADGPPDNLQTMKGVGPKLASQLNEAGITRFDQLAGLSPAELQMLDAKMGAFQGRLERDRVQEQARFLARGDRDGYQAIFGKLGGGA
ncbi:MAG TPA: helix-hairpin-helix domain-containing protein [Allosphingosinicella sp.]|jgi:predicted flap endonuclease-1-like 5' DNA nuclease